MEDGKTRAHLGQSVSLPILVFPLLRLKNDLDLFEQLPMFFLYFSRKTREKLIYNYNLQKI